MTEHNYTLEGELPKGYPEPINFAWFPTNYACETFGLPSFEGYLDLGEAIDRNPKTLEGYEKAWEILPVEDVENCVIHV